MMKSKSLVVHIVFLLTLFFSVFLATVPMVQADTTTIQPSSQDATLNAILPGVNHGDDYNLLVGAAPENPQRTIVQFDLSSITSGSTVSSATLKLYYYYYGPPNDPVGRTYWVYRVAQSWTEMGVSWKTYDAPNQWATAGGDYTSQGGISATVPGSYGWMNWDVTDIVKAWVEDGQPNCGFVIKDQNEISSLYMAKFYAREYGESTLHPILEVTLTPAIESCDAGGTRKDVFDLGEFVWVKGSGFQSSIYVDIYAVEDAATWNDGMNIGNVMDVNTDVETDADGNIPATPVWSSDLIPGKYDIVVDVNQDGVYDEGTDVLDDMDIQDTAGFLVIPEYWLGTILGLVGCFAAFGVFRISKRKHP